jgi:hypothetical protein
VTRLNPVIKAEQLEHHMVEADDSLGTMQVEMQLKVLKRSCNAFDGSGGSRTNVYKFVCNQWQSAWRPRPLKLQSSRWLQKSIARGHCKHHPKKSTSLLHPLFRHFCSNSPLLRSFFLYESSVPPTTISSSDIQPRALFTHAELLNQAT